MQLQTSVYIKPYVWGTCKLYDLHSVIAILDLCSVQGMFDLWFS